MIHLLSVRRLINQFAFVCAILIGIRIIARLLFGETMILVHLCAGALIGIGIYLLLNALSDWAKTPGVWEKQNCDRRMMRCLITILAGIICFDVANVLILIIGSIVLLGLGRWIHKTWMLVGYERGQETALVFPFLGALVAVWLLGTTGKIEWVTAIAAPLVLAFGWGIGYAMTRLKPLREPSGQPSN
jgi:hypothetical protein